MNAEIKREWVEALRSGKYKQGKGQLRSEDRFCCLGVLCDIVKDRVEGSWKGPRFRAPKEMVASLLPNCVMRLAELPFINGADVPYMGDLRSLAGINDIGRPFTEIADLIEQHL